MGLQHSFCRICIKHCSIVVETDNGVATAVHGDSSNELYRRYTSVI